jgi:hypothetical protein
MAILERMTNISAEKALVEEGGRLPMEAEQKRLMYAKQRG